MQRSGKYGPFGMVLPQTSVSSEVSMYIYVLLTTNIIAQRRHWARKASFVAMPEAGLVGKAPGHRDFCSPTLPCIAFGRSAFFEKVTVRRSQGFCRNGACLSEFGLQHGERFSRIAIGFGRRCPRSVPTGPFVHQTIQGRMQANHMALSHIRHEIDGLA